MVHHSEPEKESLQLRDLPAEELPREKLLRHGRHALSDEELIALFLRTGVHGCNVLQMAAKLKRQAGSLASLGRMEANEIKQTCHGIGPAKAATLAAVFELGQRAVKESLSQTPLDSPQAVYDYLSGDLRFEHQETMVLLLLDNHRKLIRRVNIAKGTLTRLTLHPRDIFRPAIQHNASSVIMAHNHPSGDPTPSKADVELTHNMAHASQIMLIRLVDHVIIGSPAGDRLPYYSFDEHHLLYS